MTSPSEPSIDIGDAGIVPTQAIARLSLGLVGGIVDQVKSASQNGHGSSGQALVGMARPLLPDDLWDAIAPLFPPPRPRPKGGRRPIENRAALTGIVFVLRSGLPW